MGVGAPKRKESIIVTTYQHTITLGDSEYIALSEALRLMIEHCEAQLATGAGAPYWAHKQSCANILSRMHATPAQLTSSNTFFDKS